MSLLGSALVAVVFIVIAIVIVKFETLKRIALVLISGFLIACAIFSIFRIWLPGLSLWWILFFELILIGVALINRYIREFIPIGES